ncbi:hypothetical protein C3L33_06313, partial [Rhododendron williamsianum]
MSESSSPHQNQVALLAQPAVVSAAVSSRRLPPPCWSHDETVALIDAYRDKWYSLRRGNLRANHWQEVADDVAARCPPPLSSETPTKTSVQCRHKMEKLRKRYRAELQRALSSSSRHPKGHRFNSSWVHFKRMEYMEKGPASVAAAPDLSPEDNDEEDDGDDDGVDEEEELYQSVRRGGGGGVIRQDRSVDRSISNGSGGKGGFRIRLSARPPGPTPQAKIYNNPNPNPSFGSTRVLRDGYEEKWGFGKRSGGGEGGGKKREGEPVAEIVGAIKALGDGFVRMERMKMDMAREVEAMRMEMEMKRTEMILESQQRIVEAFGKAFSEKRNKKVKRMPTPES